MKVIGITGKSGSGKTTFASLLAQKLNCKHIDVDEIGHKSLFQSEIQTSLCNKFGLGILDECGNINRKKLGDIVFSQSQKMDILNGLTWNYMKATLDGILSQDDKFIILDWALLPNSEYWNKCDFKVLVYSDDFERKVKVLERDNISEDYFNKRESASVDYSSFEFDYIFENDYNLQTMNEFVNNLNFNI